MSQPPVATGADPRGNPGSPASGSPRPDENRLVWVDMEMTGLNPSVDRIIEIAVVVTDSALSVVSQSESFAIAQTDDRLAAMDQWNQSTHARSGLLDRVRASRLSEADAEQRLLDYLSSWVPPGKSPMCGNSVCQDRRFMARYMPALESWFHYRNLDVSTLKELCRRWRPELAKGFTKRGAHTALADILESIDELRYYRDRFIRPEATP